MKIPIYQVDAFTSELFGGNPAAVCLLKNWLDDELLQKIAAENNLSETSFIVEKNGKFEIRWFTPDVEIDLCGHATLAAAFVMFNYFYKTADTIAFQSKSGILRVKRCGELLTLDFPSRRPEKTDYNEDLVKALGKKPVDILKSRDYLVVYETEEDITDLKPDFHELSKINTLGVIVTAKGRNVDFVSRFFAPAVGINEDPVTGSAHSTLIPYWAEKLGKDVLTAQQLSSRGGELFCEDKIERVLISGKVVRYLEGYIHIEIDENI